MSLYIVIVAGPKEEIPDKRAKNKPHYLNAYATLKGQFSGPNKWTTNLRAADVFIYPETAHRVAKRKGCEDYKLETVDGGS